MNLTQAKQIAKQASLENNNGIAIVYKRTGQAAKAFGKYGVCQSNNGPEEIVRKYYNGKKVAIDFEPGYQF